MTSALETTLRVAFYICAMIALIGTAYGVRGVLAAMHSKQPKLITGAILVMFLSGCSSVGVCLFLAAKI